MRTRDTGKEKLVKEKAIELLVKDGFDGFSMNKLAKACSISVATLYIYYQHKEDLIRQLALEEGKKMTDATLKGFTADMPFREGLKKQWENRSRFWLKNPMSGKFFELIRSSPYGDEVTAAITKEFSEVMKQFTHTAVLNKELRPLTLEVYWSIAFGPLLTLLRFHFEQRSIGNRPFRFNDKVMYETLDLVLKALEPS
jgi:AcrR family transcriptional regulator